MDIAIGPPNARASGCCDTAPARLTDAELLALLLRTGVADDRARTRARSPAAVRQFRRRLAHGDRHPRGAGFGPAKAAELEAVVELTRRALLEATAADALTSPEAVRDYLRLTLSALPYEVFMAMFLDSQNRLWPPRRCFAARWRRPASTRAKSSRQRWPAMRRP